jgi:undecaprenyl-diphosphatase
VAIRKSLLGGALAALLFLFLARWVRAGECMDFDLWIRSKVHSWATPLLTDVLLAITMLGSEWVMLPLGTVVVWRLTTVGRRRQAILLAAGGLGAELVSSLLKLVFHRPRPAVFFGLTPAENYSFPSGHAFVATAFYGLLAVILMEAYPRKRALILAITAPIVLLIGFSRIYLGYHYPSDVLGGWTCAAVWLALTGPPIYVAGKPQEERY